MSAKPTLGQGSKPTHISQFMSRLLNSKRKLIHSSDSEHEGPATTRSGVRPGRALFDTPPPDTQVEVLERSQRSRKASARKLEWLKSQEPSKTSKPPTRRRNPRNQRLSLLDDEDDDEFGETSNGVTSETLADTGPAVSDTQLATVGAPGNNPIAFLSKAGVLYQLKEELGHDVSHLSARELEKLANSISKSKAAAMEPTKWHTPAVVQPATDMELGGGYYRRRYGNSSGSQSPPQPHNVHSGPSSQPQKRPPSPLSLRPSKHLRVGGANADDEDANRHREHQDELPPNVLDPPPNNNSTDPFNRYTMELPADTRKSRPVGTAAANSPSQISNPPLSRLPPSLGTTESEESDAGGAAGQPPTCTPNPPTRTDAQVPGSHASQGSKPLPPLPPRFPPSLGTTESEGSDAGGAAAGQPPPRARDPPTYADSRVPGSHAPQASKPLPPLPPIPPHFPPSLGTTESEESDAGGAAAGQPPTHTPNPPTRTNSQVPSRASQGPKPLPPHFLPSLGTTESEASGVGGAAPTQLATRTPKPHVPTNRAHVPPSLGTTEDEESDIDGAAADQRTSTRPTVPTRPALSTRPLSTTRPTHTRATDDPLARASAPSAKGTRGPVPAPVRSLAPRSTSRDPPPVPLIGSAGSLTTEPPPPQLSYLPQKDIRAILEGAFKVASSPVEHQGEPYDPSAARYRPLSSPAVLDRSPAAESLRASGAGSSRRRSATLAGGVRGPLPSANNPIESDAEALQDAKLIASGKGKARKKPGLGDYPGVRQQLAKLTVPKMLVKAITNDSYACTDQYCEWIEDVFHESWEEEASTIPYESPGMPWCKIIARRAGTHRTGIKVDIRPIMETTYEFIIRIRSDDDIRHNRELAKKLELNFIYKDVDQRTDPYEHEAISRAIAKAYFPDKKAIGVKYPKDFYPMPLPAVALVLTIMQFCISEWESGRHENLELDAEEQQPVFDVHLAGLKRYARKSGARMERFQKEWYHFGMDCIAAKQQQSAHCQPILPDDRIRPDTPPPT